MRGYRRIIVVWMLATTMHLPLPVCDGDNLASGHARPATAVASSQTLDLDFVLLGCDPPDDSDDGPLDDDPEDGSDSPFGHAYTLPRSNSAATIDAALSWTVSDWLKPHGAHIDAAQSILGCRRRRGPAMQQLSYGQQCGSGVARLRC